MNKNLSSNSYVPRINGYLDALSDIDGGQREFFASFGIIQAENISVESELKIVSPFMEDIKIIQKVEYPNTYGITYLLEKLLLIKPFQGLYQDSLDKQISDDIIKTYRDYIIFHLEDFFDFAFEEVAKKLSRNTFDVQLLLVKYRNNRNNSIDYFISIKTEIKDIKQFLNFYRKEYTEKDFKKDFNEIVIWDKKREQESKEKFPMLK